LALPGVSLANDDAKGIPAIEKERMASHEVDASKMKFKPGKGLQISSTNGQFQLTTRLRAQMRYTLEQDGGEFAHGFQLRRARLLFTGHVFGKDNRYKFELAVSPKDIGLKSSGTISKSPLLDWYFHFSQLRDLNVRIGQYKVPFSRQRVVSSGNLQMVDRSMANGEFNLDRDVGLDFRSKDLGGLGFLRYYAGVYMGEGHSSYATGDFGLMYLARIEALPLGMFKDYSEGAFARSSKAQLSIGAAFGYVDEAKKNKGIVGSVPSDGGTTDTMNFTTDVSLRVSGLSLESAFFWRDGTRNPGDSVDEAGEAIAAEAARNGMGYYGQVGYLIPNQPLEMSARFGQLMSAGDDSSLSDKSEVGLGLNYYFAQHAMKLQADYFHFWGEDGFAEGSDQVRIQMQMAY
jgi:hypothetical protein